MTTSDLLACMIGPPSGFVIWSAVFRLPGPFAKWALQPFGRTGQISMGIAMIFGTIFMISAGFVVLFWITETITLPSHFADTTVRRLILGWSAVGYVLPLITIRLERDIKRKLQRNHRS
jgi:biotin transporter BioY